MTDADLVVWRHGRTAWNDEGRFQGHVDTPLDLVGHRQAKAAALALASLTPVSIVSSDLARARDTASYLAAACSLPLALDERLREIDVGEWGGLSRDEIAARFPSTYNAWLAGEDVRREGGETGAEVTARALAAVRDALAASAGGPVVVCSHGGTSRSVVLALLGLPESARSAFAVLGNARWASLVRRGEGWRLTAYNAGADAEAAVEGRIGGAATEPVL